MLANAISEVSQGMRRRTENAASELTTLQRTVTMLQDKYKEKLTTQQLVQAFDVMLNEGKAGIFVILQAGEARGAWLEKQVDSSV